MSSRLKLLIVSRQVRSRSFSTLFNGLSNCFDTTLLKLSKEDIRNFASIVPKLNCEQYDRVMFDIPLRRIGKGYKVLKSISGLILYEEDACQEFIRRSEYYKKYIKIYRELSMAEGCRVILTGFNVGEQFRQAGLDVHVIPKAFDENHLKDLSNKRDVEQAFVGRIKNKVYKKRQKFLQSLVANEGLKLFKTDPGEEYLLALNRIKIFVSADIGFLEYMAKNFEAMACGCLVLAKRQGGVEEEKLGLIHMENIVLYNDVFDAVNLLSYLKGKPEVVKSIACNGRKFVEERHSLGSRINSFSLAIEKDVTSLEKVKHFKLLGRWM